MRGPMLPGSRVGSWGWGLLAPLACIGLGAALFLWNPVAVQVLRHTVFDQFQRWQPRAYTPSPVRIIDIDDESLKRLGQWPWPRTRVAELTTRLQQAQPAVIGFDVLFTEPDRTSPQAMQQLWQAPPPLREAMSQLPDPDAVLADALSRSNVVLGFALDRPAPVDATPIPTALPTAFPNVLPIARPTAQAKYVALGVSALPFVHEFTSATVALAPLQSQAKGSGALSFVPDSDGVVRRVPLVVRIGNALLPTLAAEMLRVKFNAQNYITRTGASADSGLESVQIGPLAVPTTAQGEVWLHYTPAAPQRTIAAWRVLAGEVPEADLQGGLLLVGTSAPGLMDLRFSPLGHPLPGVEVHAQLLEQTLGGGALFRPAWAMAIEALALVVGGATVGLVALSCSALLSLGVLSAMLLALWAGAWQAFAAHGLLLDAALPSAVLLLSHAAASIVHHFASERRQAWVRQAFSRYVSPNLVSHLIDHPGALELGGKRQQCSFVFTDLAGFTALMEKTSPADAVALLNVYLDRMIAIAFAHEGTLDRIVGDAVAIMFSAPLPQPDHQARALSCALAMQRFAMAYEAELKPRGIAFGQTRIGVHSGEVIVGNFGGATIFDYRALGDPVNTTSRLESANKQLGTLVCVSQATLAGCPQALARPIGRVLLQGKSVPLMVFEALDVAHSNADLSHQPTYSAAYLAAYLTAYGDAFELMRQGQHGALPAFAALARERPDDALVQLHLQRLQAGAADDLIALTQK